MRSIRGRCIKFGLVVATLVACCLGWYWFSNWRSASLLKNADRDLLVHQRSEVAEELARKVLWYSPEDDQGLLILGVSLNRQKKFAESIPWLERVRPTSEFKPEADLTLASSLLNSGWFRRCEEVLVSHLKASPHDTQAQDLLIPLFKQTLRFPEIVQLYETRLSGTPDDESTLRTLLDFLSANPEAGAITAKLLASPRLQQEPDGLAALGQAAVLGGDSASADSNFSKALTLDPTNIRTILWSSAFYLSTGRVDSASALLNRCKERDITGPRQTPWIRAEYWRFRAMVAGHDNDLSAALGHCELSLQCLPQPETLSLKAGLLRRLNRPGEATTAATQVAHLGYLDFELLKLSTELRSKPLTVELAIQASTILEGLGYHTQSAAWKTMAVALSPVGN
jgi:tetratricopeptide (TPR) repeat protein